MKRIIALILTGGPVDGDAARAFIALTSLPGRIALIALALLLYALSRLLPEPKTSASDSPPPTPKPLEAS